MRAGVDFAEKVEGEALYMCTTEVNVSAFNWRVKKEVAAIIFSNRNEEG